MLRLVSIAIVGIALGACGRSASPGAGSVSASRAAGAGSASRAEIVDLSSSLAPIQAAFDARRGAPRFLALLSPT